MPLHAVKHNATRAAAGTGGNITTTGQCAATGGQAWSYADAQAACIDLGMGLAGFTPEVAAWQQRATVASKLQMITLHALPFVKIAPKLAI